MPVKKKTSKVLDSTSPDADSPVPVEFAGLAFTTLNDYQYIPFFAPLDNLFRTLMEARLLSPTQGNCINDKVFYSVGDGLQVQDQIFPTAFDKRINAKRETVDDILKTAFDSYYQDGNVFIEVARIKVGKERFIRVNAMNNMDCRLEDPKDGSEPTHVIRTRLFRKNGIVYFDDNDKPIKVPLWTDNPIKDSDVWAKDPDNKNVERTMLHIKHKCVGYDYYGLPSNFAGFLNVLLEYKSARFNMDNFENNMFLGGILMIQGNLSDTESQKLVKNVRKMYTGAGKGQRILPVSSEGGISDSKFIPFNETHEGHFTEFDSHNENKIIGANSWSKDLLDLKETSGLGKGGDYLKQLFKIKFRTVISPAQQIMLNNFIFPLMQIIDQWKGTSFYKMPWIIKPVIPVSFEGTLNINSLLTVDEGREEIGKKPMGGEKGKKLISEVGAKPAGQKGGEQP